MGTFSRTLVVAAVSIGLAACGGGGGSGPSEPNPSPLPPPAAGTVGDGRLDELLEWARASEDVPAIAMVMVERGQIAEIAAAGRRSLTAAARVTTDDRWHLGSLTKAMTATLAGVLVEQSVIGWDTTPLEIWPELDETIHPGFRTITLKQLLSHTSGMRRVNDVPARFYDAATGTSMSKRRSWASELLRGAPETPIGMVSYSNGGYVVAGAMLESVTGTSWETLLQQQVFGPLGMVETGFGAPGTSGKVDQPRGHWDREGHFDPVTPGPDADNPQALGPAGTVHATLSDYAQFMIAHIAGARGTPGLVTAETFETLHTPVSEGSALGWGFSTREDWAQGPVLAHSGSNNRWFAVVRLAPSLDAGALIVVNAGGRRADAAIDSLSDLILERFEAGQ